jgi:hypothetical protein
MKLSNKIIVGLGLCFAASVAMATPPKQLITHNNTDVESNAYIAGTIPSQHPTYPHSDNKVTWTAVRMACFGHLENKQCSAVIKMATNTATPVELGTVYVDIETGEITPKFLSGNGYTMTVNGPGETTLDVQY